MATIGFTVGGGMAAGAMITATAPVAISTAVIYGPVKIFKNWLKRLRTEPHRTF